MQKVHHVRYYTNAYFRHITILIAGKVPHLNTEVFHLSTSVFFSIQGNLLYRLNFSQIYVFHLWKHGKIPKSCCYTDYLLQLYKHTLT